MISTPKKKTTLYEEIPINRWNNQEWILYNEFKDNTRVQAFPILKKYKIRYETIEKWISELPQYASIYSGFYPQGAGNYFASDFLFQSDFHIQLTNVLGLLPSTSVFFSVDHCLLARLCVFTKSEENDLISLIHQLEEKGYFTHFAMHGLYSIKEAVAIEKKRKEDFLRLIGFRGTILILRFLNTVDSVQILERISKYPHSHQRGENTLRNNLIRHHVDKKGVRREWYEITKNGKFQWRQKQNKGQIIGSSHLLHV